VFTEIIAESETYHIYKAVLLTIKVAARNVSGAREKKELKSNPQHNTAILDVGLLLFERD
jgi:hypothetical protein